MDNLIQQDLVSSVQKVFTILQALGERNESGLSELSKRLKMSKASTYRFLQTMKSIGFVDQKGDADKYVLTLKLFELGSKAREYTNLFDVVKDDMQELAEATKEAVHLGVLYIYTKWIHLTIWKCILEQVSVFHYIVRQWERLC